MLTDRLIRMEWHPDGTFVDEATQAVVDRALTTPEFRVTDTGDRLEIRTRELHLVYDKQEFSPAGLSVTLLRNAPDPHYATWRYGQEFPDTLPFRGNLRGTVRTLDEVDGACDLEDGLLSTYGFSVLDDSATALMTADGWIGPRPAGGRDLYFFGHGRDFTGALQDYFRLTGPTPLLPRYALGNW
ncbi:MAG: glycoside hydrolase, partial [Cellulomonadaceae bacterium]